LVELARGRIEDGTTTFTTSLSHMIESNSSDPLVLELLNRELCAANALLHTFGDDYATMAAKYRSKASNVNRNYSTEYLDTLSQFSDGRLPGMLIESSDLANQVRENFIETSIFKIEAKHFRAYILRNLIKEKIVMTKH
jgi:hypothetical protein